ncbi:hypothetical protein TW79_05130 [Tritonibacter mobilis]|uniref:Uncharacterized protein n=1 Tax=Tritonibacter mobilis F1926 TaxID=1265309 RepID=A0A1B1A200_9RHOB|nr:hypothetical protein K529_007485 [Tritonibacter mobilis F1926]KJZ25052.1 hypothetical protein TW79_05130 [Tritonibacter mobilis]
MRLAPSQTIWVAPQAYDVSNSHAKFYIYPVRAARFRFGNRLIFQSIGNGFQWPRQLARAPKY